jgi:hypothetical protein
MRDLLYFVIGILLGLICIFFDGSTVMAQGTSTDCFRNGASTACQSRDYYGRTTQRTTCWPNGATLSCTTQP